LATLLTTCDQLCCASFILITFSRFQDIPLQPHYCLYLTFEVPEPQVPLTLDHGTLNFGNLHISLYLRCIRCE